jgi:hypothetical protein
MIRVVLPVAAWLVLITMLWASDSRPAVAVLGGVVAVVAAGLVVVIDLGRSAAPPWSPRTELPAARPGSDPRVSSLHRDIDGAEWTESTALHDSIVDLVDDRLRTGHGIDREADPDAADAVLSPALRDFVARPRRSDTSARRLDRVLTDLEEL